MSERPILMSAPMVLAILGGTKTQTRRALRAQPPAGTFQVSTWHHPDPRPHFFAWQELPHDTAMIADDWSHPCPYGRPGDRLWVRETFAKIEGQTQPWIETDYRATYTHGDRLGDHLGIKKRWTPAIHMPRAASRITLEITEVRVERLQEISEADCRAEGIHGPGEDVASDLPNCPCRAGVGLYTAINPGAVARPDTDCNLCDTPIKRYRLLWEGISGPGSWDANPWVWVIGFRRLDGRAHNEFTSQ